MRLVTKLKTFFLTAVSDLFSEETQTTDPFLLHLRQTQTRLNQLRDELAQAIAREKRAETAWRTAQAHQYPETALLEQQHQTFVQVTTALHLEIDRLQTQLMEIGKQTGQLNEREESVLAMERLQQLRKEINKTADSLHTALQDRTEQVAVREDKTAAREEIEEVKRRLQL